MSKPKHNYSQYSNNKNTQPAENEFKPLVQELAEAAAQEVIPEVVPAVETVVTPVVAPAPEPAPKTVEGTVVGCTKLNVRAYPSLKADIVCVINAADKVVVNPAKSNKDWFKINTADGAEGFCMRKFVNAKV